MMLAQWYQMPGLALLSFAIQAVVMLSKKIKLKSKLGITITGTVSHVAIDINWLLL